MRQPSNEQIEALRKEYPEGALVELIEMQDEQSPPPGTIGRVIAIDDLATLHVAWRTGSTLGIIPGVDRIRKLIMTEKVYQDLLSIRSGGKSNMLDYRAVQRLAYDAGYYELVTYIEEHTKQYIHFIMYGREG